MLKRTLSTTCISTLSRLMVAAGVILLPDISPAATIAHSAPPVEIRLWSAVTVRAGEIRLGQLARITGPEALCSPLQNLVLIDPPKGGGSVQLRAWQVAAQLGTAGFDVSKIRITGSAVCAINHVPSDTPNPAEPGRSKDLEADLGGPATLEHHLRRIIGRNLDTHHLPADTQVKISFNPTLRPVLALTDPPYRFEISPPRTSNGLGLVAFKVQIYRDRAVRQSLSVLAEVQLRAPVLIAIKPINGKARINRQDVERSWRELNFPNARIVTRLDDLADRQAKKMIHPGTVLTSDLLEPVPLVRRGQLVTVLYHRGGLDIRIVGKALQTAFKGEVIPVRNERSKEVFRARVTGEGQVSVEDHRLDGRPELASGNMAP